MSTRVLVLRRSHPSAQLGLVSARLGLVGVPGASEQPIIVTARLNGRATARLVLDTGADVSVCSPERLQEAGVDLTRPATSGSALGVGGGVPAKFYSVSVSVDGHQVTLPYVAGIDMGESGSDGLLGRDFLDQFVVTLNAGVLKLRPLSVPTQSPSSVG